MLIYLLNEEAETIINTSAKAATAVKSVNLRMTQKDLHTVKGYTGIEKCSIVIYIVPFFKHNI